MEHIVPCSSLEHARNSALKKLRELGGHHGPYRKVVIGKNMAGASPVAGARIGVEYEKPWVRLRLDFDTGKGPHYNVESKQGDSYAFTFPRQPSDAPFAQMSQEERDEVQAWMARIGARMRR